MGFGGQLLCADARAYSTLCARLTPSLQIGLYPNHSNHLKTFRLFEQLKVSREVQVWRYTKVQQLIRLTVIIAYQCHPSNFSFHTEQHHTYKYKGLMGISPHNSLRSDVPQLNARNALVALGISLTSGQVSASIAGSPLAEHATFVGYLLVLEDNLA